jgi:hypothetical protein
MKTIGNKFMMWLNTTKDNPLENIAQEGVDYHKEKYGVPPHHMFVGKSYWGDSGVGDVKYAGCEIHFDKTLQPNNFGFCVESSIAPQEPRDDDDFNNLEKMVESEDKDRVSKFKLKQEKDN